MIPGLIAARTHEIQKIPGYIQPRIFDQTLWSLARLVVVHDAAGWRLGRLEAVAEAVDRADW